MMRRAIVLVFVFISLVTHAQKDTTATSLDNNPPKSEKIKNNNPVLGSIRLAEDYINQKLYKKAKLELEAVIKKRSKLAVAHRLLGLIYFEFREYPAAIENYIASFDLNPALSRAAYFECGESLFKLNRFDEALENFRIYDEMKNKRYANSQKEERAERYFDSQLPVSIQNCKLLQAEFDSPVCEVPSNLGHEVNSIDEEYFPSTTINGEFLLFTRRKQVYPDIPENYDENINISHKTGSGWSVSVPLKGVINTGQNEGLAKFTFGTNQYYFASCQRNDPTRGCDIFFSELDKKASMFLEEPEGRLNSDAWDSQPCSTCDEKTIYFASNREGGLGGTDIWMSTLVKGQWSIPSNLGPTINSPGDEEGPFIAADGKTLYFSSNGRPGYGEMDVFVSRLSGSVWGEPKHLGYPVNSQFNETGIFVTADGKKAYVSSDRLGGEGGLDLYEVMLPEEFRPIPMVVAYGTVMDKYNSRGVEAVVNAMHDGEKYSIETNKVGEYSMCIPLAPSFAFHVDKQDYEMYIEATMMNVKEGENTLNWDILLTGIDGLETSYEQASVQPAPKQKPTETKEKPEDLFNSNKESGGQYGDSRPYDQTIISMNDLVFYFESGSAELTEESTVKLDRLRLIMRTDPRIVISVKGYADDIGSMSKNIELSEKRADAVYDKLMEMGVRPEQVKAVGMGEVRAYNADDESRSQHRKVEIEIITGKRGVQQGR